VVAVGRVERGRGPHPVVGGLPDDGSVRGQGAGVDPGEGQRVETEQPDRRRAHLADEVVHGQPGRVVG
jgi:hypothetical protein